MLSRILKLTAENNFFWKTTCIISFNIENLTFKNHALSSTIHQFPNIILLYKKAFRFIIVIHFIIQQCFIYVVTRMCHLISKYVFKSRKIFQIMFLNLVSLLLLSAPFSPFDVACWCVLFLFSFPTEHTNVTYKPSRHFYTYHRINWNDLLVQEYY